MDDESGLSPSAQGLNPPEVQSGIHAQQLIEQTVVGLSSIKQNTESGLVRLYRVMLEQIRAFYTTEQTLQVVGDDGQVKEEAWSKTDLGSAKDVRIQRGSMSMLSPSSKAVVAEHLFSMQLIDQEELRRMALANAGGVMALEDDPHRLRIARQVREWEEGPPEGWQPPQAPVDPMTGQPQVDPMTGQPVPPPPDPMGAEIFDQRLSDTLPAIVPIRLNALARCISGVTYGGKPLPWRALLDGEFQRMSQAAQASAPQPKSPVVESMNYKDTPPDVQREIEQQAGLQPSRMPPEQLAQIDALRHPAPAPAQHSTTHTTLHSHAASGNARGAPKPIDSASGEPLPHGVKDLAALPPQLPQPSPM